MAFSPSPRLARWLAAAALVVMLITGLCTFQDYGFTIDEPVEHASAIINYQYMLKKLFNRDLRVVDEDLSTYRDRYYGVALQTLPVVVEDLAGFQLQNYHVFLIRHLYTFLLCMAGYVCFYFFLRNVFENDWLALLGMLMLALYPRFWGEQFTNIKDMVFMATVCAGLLCVSLCLKHEGKWRYEVLAAFVFALSTNTRMIGLMLPAMLLGYRVLRDWLVTHVARQRGAAALWKGYARYAAQLAMMLAFYVLITPAAWEHPLRFMREAFLTFSNYSVFDCPVNVLGTAYPPNALPWYYLPLWVGVSIPLWYLLLLGISLPVSLIRAVGEARREGWAKALLLDERYNLLCWVIVLLPFITVLVKETTLYNSWRHFFYIFPSFVTLTLFTVRSLWRRLSARTLLRRALPVALCALLALQGVWIAKNHPMEKVYLNPVGRRVGHLLERDYWLESVYHQLQYILAHDPGDRSDIRVSCYNRVGVTYLNFLTYQEQERIQMVTENGPDEDYIIMTYNDFEPTPIEGYALIHEINVDGVVISRLLLKESVLQERFGGAYPN